MASRHCNQANGCPPVPPWASARCTDGQPASQPPVRGSGAALDAQSNRGRAFRPCSSKDALLFHGPPRPHHQLFSSRFRVPYFKLPARPPARHPEASTEECSRGKSSPAVPPPPLKLRFRGCCRNPILFPSCDSEDSADIQFKVRPDRHIRDRTCSSLPAESLGLSTFVNE